MEITYSGNPYARLSFVTMLLLLEIACFYPFYLKKDKYTVLRCLITGVVTLGICFGCPEYIGKFSLGSFSTIPFYLITIVAWMIVTNYSFYKVLFFSTIAYALENLTVNLTETVVGSIEDYTQTTCFLIELPIFIICFIVALIASCKREKEDWNIGADAGKFVLIAAVSLFAFDILTKFGARQGLRHNPVFKGTMALVDVLILVILWFLHHTRSLKTEKEQIEEMLKSEKEQYLFLTEEIDRIHFIYHDLKHQLANEKFKTDHYRAEALQAVKDFETIAKTGNKAFDSVLTQKTVLANKYNIEISFFITPHSLDNVSDSDIYSLFSNAIDNAIECIKRENPKENRQIIIRVSEKKGFIKIHVENPCQNQPLFSEHDLPLTTKKNKSGHGFGTKSIQYIIRKYDGNLVFSWNNNTFFLDAVLQTEA